MNKTTMLSLVEHLPVPLILLNPKGEVVLLNKLSLDLARRIGKKDSASEITPDHFLDFKDPFWIEKINHCLKDGEIEFVEGRQGYICKMKIASSNSSDRLTQPSQLDSNIWLSIIETDQHKKYFTMAHDETAQNAKIKEMSEMAASIAHEINNPLTVIYAKTHYLKEFLEKRENSDSTVLLAQLSKIHQHSERIYKIVSGMRSFSRDARHDPLIDYSISKVITEALSLMNSRIQILGVEVDLSPIPDNLTIQCWPSLLLQVLLNLIKNAIDSIEAMPFPKLKINVESNLNRVSIYVSDSGPGVSAENESKIFSPFFTTKPVGSGTGIGLSISIKIVTDHGGKLRLDRSRGNSCFVIELPLQKSIQMAK